MSHAHAFSCIRPLHSIYLNYFWNFSECFFLPPHSLVYVSVSWHQKVRLLRPETLYVLGHLLLLIPPPYFVQLHDEQARKDISKNFFRRGIHSECQVILLDFSDIDLPTVIHSRVWEPLCDIPVSCPSVLIQELYSNVHGLDSSLPLFITCI